MSESLLKSATFVQNPCYYCGGDSVWAVTQGATILGRITCRLCVDNFSYRFFMEDKKWADRNPFVISILLGLLTDKIYCPFKAEWRFDEPILTRHIHSVPIPNGKLRLREHRLRFPLTGEYNYRNIIKHYPQVKEQFEGKNHD